MKNKLLIESMLITTMLATIVLSTLSASVFAWTGYDTGFASNTDNSTWQVSARVTGYYWTAGQYEEVLFQSWRGCVDPVTYESGLRIRWIMAGPYGTADSVYQWIGDENGPYYQFQYYQTSSYGMDYVTTASSYSGAYFKIGGVDQFKQCTANI